jgi:phosphonoacetaldehyde hydrolase
MPVNDAHQAPNRYTGPVRAVVLDWAGTAVDYGCLGPAQVFVEIFAAQGVAVGLEEARRFMGLEKRAHIRRMCGEAAVAARWSAVHGRPPGEGDIDRLYEATVPLMAAAAAARAAPIPGLLDAVAAWREQGIKLGSTTGYTAPIMAALRPAAAKQGYRPDAVVCATEVPAGRPYPWMCYLNAIRLEVFPMAAMVKIGDTLPDISEGLNAGMWTVGVTCSGNEMGLDAGEVAEMAPAELEARLAPIRRRFREAGAHYVIDGIWQAAPVVAEINRRLARGETPCTPAG